MGGLGSEKCGKYKNVYRVLLTGCGAPGAAGIIKCLRKGAKGDIFIAGVDANSNAYGKCMVDAFQTVPAAEEPDFLSIIQSFCKKHDIQVILPIVTRELPVFAKAKTQFQQLGIQVCVSDENILEQINNKYLLLEALKKQGLPTPQYFLCRDVAEFKQACLKLGYPQNIVCFKPVVSNGSRGFRIVSDQVDELSLLFKEKPNSLYISYKKAVSLLESGPFPPLVVMEYLPGEEWSVDCLVDHGKALYVIPRLRTKMSGGISINASVVKDNLIISRAQAICEKLQLHGNIGIQFRMDQSNTTTGGGYPQILEINPRLQGTVVLCAAAGVNLPYFGVRLALGHSIPTVEPHWGIRMCRYWEEAYFDADGQPFTY